MAHRNGDAKNVSALFLHMHNATGDLSGTNGAAGERAQVLRVSSNSELPPRARTLRMFRRTIRLQTTLTGWLSVVLRPATDGTFRPNGSVSAARWRRSSTVWRVRRSSRFGCEHPERRMRRAITRSSKEIEWMRARGITTGWSDGTFRPNAAVNRDAMAAFFYRFAGSHRRILLRWRRRLVTSAGSRSIVRFRGWLSSVLHWLG